MTPITPGQPPSTEVKCVISFFLILPLNELLDV